jgi:hypothetical protein
VGKEKQVVVDAFRKYYGDMSRYGDSQAVDDWYCEKLGNWAIAWGAALEHEQSKIDALVDACKAALPALTIAAAVIGGKRLVHEEPVSSLIAQLEAAIAQAEGES